MGKPTGKKAGGSTSKNAEKAQTTVRRKVQQILKSNGVEAATIYAAKHGVKVPTRTVKKNNSAFAIRREATRLAKLAAQ